MLLHYIEIIQYLFLSAAYLIIVILPVLAISVFTVSVVTICIKSITLEAKNFFKSVVSKQYKNRRK
jgi:hypothetical protein